MMRPAGRASRPPLVPAGKATVGRGKHSRMDVIKKHVAEIKDRVIEARRDLHRIPEPAYTETKTAAYVAEALSAEALDVQTGIARTGVVALLDSARPGPTVMIRADMDALPIQEKTGLPFASIHEGAMHACGHDAHMAMVLGAAGVLGRMRDRFQGRVKFVFQPAEEGPGGAKPMIEAGGDTGPCPTCAWMPWRWGPR